MGGDSRGASVRRACSTCTVSETCYRYQARFSEENARIAEVARRFPGRQPSKQPRLIAITGWGQHADRAKVKAAGFDWHLKEPVSLDDLKQAVALSAGT